MGERGRAKSGCVGLGEPEPIAQPILPFLRLHVKPPANLSRGIARYLFAHNAGLCGRQFPGGAAYLIPPGRPAQVKFRNHTRLRSSLVSLPHCCCTLPFICFQFPSTRSQFIVVSCLAGAVGRFAIGRLDSTKKQDVAGKNPATSRVAGRARGEGDAAGRSYKLPRKNRFRGLAVGRARRLGQRAAAETIRFASAFRFGKL